MFTLTDDNTFVCDHCGIDYSECGCLGGEPDVFKVQLDNLKVTLRDDDDFDLCPVERFERRDDAHPFCLACGSDLPEWDSPCTCDDDCAYAPWEFDDDDV